MRRTKESVPPGDEARGGNWFQMKQEVESGDKERAVSDREKGGRAPSLDTNTHTESEFTARASKEKKFFLILTYSLHVGHFFYPHTLLPPCLPSIPFRLDTFPPSSFIHTSSAHLFLVLATISPSPSLTKSCTAKASSSGSALIAVCLYVCTNSVSVCCRRGPLSHTLALDWLDECYQEVIPAGGSRRSGPGG